MDKLSHYISFDRIDFDFLNKYDMSNINTVNARGAVLFQVMK